MASTTLDKFSQSSVVLNKLMFHFLRGIFIAAVVIAIITVVKGSVKLTKTGAQDSTSPNFLVIVSDDQRFDTINYMPETKKRIFGQGVTFTNAFATTSLCCPGRASVLTGMYAHTHGVINNKKLLNKETFLQKLHDAGYYTGLIGKYLNSSDGSPLPRVDRWVSFQGGAGQLYTNPTLNIDGKLESHTGYSTYILRDYVLDFFEKAKAQNKAFALYFTPYNPHQPFTAAPEDRNLYPSLSPYRPPSFNEKDMRDKPNKLQERFPPMTNARIDGVDKARIAQLRSLKSLDRAVASILDDLAKRSLLDNTVIIYLSDNGYTWGEHRIPKLKNFVYEESARVPFGFRYPPLVSSPKTETKIVGNIDIAPTIYELAGIPIPSDVDGKPMANLLKGNEPNWRTDIMLEAWGNQNWQAVRTEGYVYAEHQNDKSELYDLAKDKYQLTNKINDPAYASIISDMKSRLNNLRTSVENTSIFNTVIENWNVEDED